jgi:hypothetical protein
MGGPGGVLAFQVLIPTDVPRGSPLHTRIRHWVDSGGSGCSLHSPFPAKLSSKYPFGLLAVRVFM